MTARLLLISLCLAAAALIGSTMLHADNADLTAPSTQPASGPTTRSATQPSTHPAAAATRPAADKRPVHKVKTAKEFVDAIGSDRIIQIEPGDYNLTDFAKEEHKPRPHVQIGTSYAQSEEEPAVQISRVKNLTIRCIGETKARLLAEPDSNVLKIGGSTNVELFNLELVHTSAPCSAECLWLTDCDGITVRDCTISGCGVVGIDAESVTDLHVDGCSINKCSSLAAMLKNCDKVHFRDTTISSNQGGLKLADCTGVEFINCEISENVTQGNLIEMKTTTGVRMEAGSVRDNKFNKLSTEDIQVKNVKIQDNGPAPKDGEGGEVPNTPGN